MSAGSGQCFRVTSSFPCAAWMCSPIWHVRSSARKLPERRLGEDLSSHPRSGEEWDAEKQALTCTLVLRGPSAPARDAGRPIAVPCRNVPPGSPLSPVGGRIAVPATNEHMRITQNSADMLNRQGKKPGGPVSPPSPPMPIPRIPVPGRPSISPLAAAMLPSCPMLHWQKRQPL